MTQQGVFSMAVLSMPVRSSNMFPYTMPCGKCNSTGEGGDEATYCQHCHGGGKITVQGVISGTGLFDAQMTLICDYHPPLFKPSFPFALPVRPWPGFRS